MCKRSILVMTGAIAGMLILIFDSRTAAAGIRCGIDICLQTLVPALFPFFVLSGLITSSLFGQAIPGLSTIGKFCHIPEGSESILTIGLLGGYPVGAGTVWNAYENGEITAEEADRMVIFCNNAGPSFLFGVLGPMFPALSYVWSMWGIQIIAALLTAFLIGGNRRITTVPANCPLRFTDAINNAIRNMTSVCGWVILFRMILEFLDRWFLWNANPPVTVLITGILELSNGCLLLQNINNLEIRFLLASMMLSVGGLCILMQTHAVFPELKVKQYLTGKLIQLTLSLILSMTAVFVMSGRMLHSAVCMGLLIIGISAFRMRLRKRKIAVAIP